MKRTHPENLLEEMLVQNVFSWAAPANERKPPSKSLQRNARRVEFKAERRRGFLLTFHSTSLLFFAFLCCSVREGRCCTLQRSSTSLLLLHNLNIPPSFQRFGCVHTISVPLIHTARQSILFYSPRALLLLLGLQLCILSPEGGVECSVLTISVSWDSRSNKYFHNKECLLEYFLLLFRVPVSRLGPG